MQRTTVLNIPISLLPLNSLKVFLLYSILFSSLIMSVVYSKDWAGWLLLVGTFLPLYFLDRIRSNPKLFWALFIGLCIHHLVSIANFYVFPHISNITDSKTFNDAAMQIAMTHHFLFSELRSLDWCLYSDFLSLFYMICPSEFLGQELSIFAFVLSCILILKLTDLFKIGKYDFIIIFLFGIFPSYVLFSSLILREPWQLLLFLLAIYYGYLWYSSGKVLSKHMLFYFVACLFLSRLHTGITVYIAFFIMLYAFTSFIKEKINWKITSITLLLSFIAATLLLTFAFFWDPFTHNFALIFFYKIHGSKLHSLLHLRDSYIQSVGLANSTYPYATKSKFLNTILFYMCYLFGPFSGFKSAQFLLVALMSWVRMILVILSICYLFISKKPEKWQMLIFALIYFSFTFFWSYGTNNYGTAIRHNILTDWLIILIGIKAFAVLYDRYQLSRQGLNIFFKR